MITEYLLFFFSVFTTSRAIQWYDWSTIIAKSLWTYLLYPYRVVVPCDRSRRAPLENYKGTGKHRPWSSFFSKGRLISLSSHKKKSIARCFSVKNSKLFSATFIQNDAGRLLLPTSVSSLYITYIRRNCKISCKLEID